MDECHKLLTNKVDLSNPEGHQILRNIYEPLPLGGPPGQVFENTDTLPKRDNSTAVLITKIQDLNKKEKDFKNLHPNDFEDLFLLNIQESSPTAQDRQDLVFTHQSNNMDKKTWWIRNRPEPFYRDRNDQRNDELNEQHKFSEDVDKIIGKTDHKVKDFHLFEYNKGMETRKCQDTYPILLSFTHCGNKSILRVLRIILVILPEHPSETKVFHNEDGNPARANIKQALVIMESLVKKKQKGAILELKRRHLKNTIFCTNTSLGEEKAHKRGKVFNWQTATYRKIRVDDDLHNLSFVETEFLAIVFNDTLTSEAALSCEPMVSSLNNDEIDFRISFDESDDEFCTPTVSYFDDLDYFKDFEKEFPTIVYNDAQTSKSYLLTEPISNPQHIDEFNLKDETSLSECDKEEQNVLNFNDLFPFNVIYPDELKTDTDNDNDKVDIEHSLGDLSVKPLPDLINIDVGAYAHGSNKLLETSHDTSNKFIKTETFIKELNFNIITWNHLNKGISFIFLIKNLYVPFGIPFNPKLFYKDGSKLGQVVESVMTP
ncbi:hypothetical protein Tco_0926947 [Tanacetum coccineum]|uniref:Uncharacterized protein n=1 Tax=Tanacetum coccineum TaxID=301880 RepID=A0ABQ5DD81_9ASTR